MHDIKHIVSGCLSLFLAANLLTGCGLFIDKTPETTTDTMPLPTTTTFAPPTTIQITTQEEITTETEEANTTFSNLIADFLAEKDSDFISYSDCIITHEHIYLVLYSTNLEENTYRLALANPETDMFEIILENTPLLYLQSIDDENSFQIIRGYHQITIDGLNTFIPAPFELVHYYRADSSFIEEVIPATLSIEDPSFQDYVFGNDNFDTAILTELIIEKNALRIRQNISKTAEDRTSSLTHLTYDAEKNSLILSMDCHDSVNTLPDVSENEAVQEIILSTAEEGSTLEIYLLPTWDRVYHIKEELISEEENSYIIDTILSFVPYTAEENIEPETTAE